MKHIVTFKPWEFMWIALAVLSAACGRYGFNFLSTDTDLDAADTQMDSATEDFVDSETNPIDGGDTEAESDSFLDSDTAETDSSTDTVVDTEVETDVETDTETDTGTDTDTDSTTDTVMDIDAGIDTDSDIDTGTDTGTGIDTDTSSDTETETETETETNTDSFWDGGVDAGMDAGTDGGDINCTCFESTSCCDGCLPTNMGDDCEHLDLCIADSTCNNGTCVGVPQDCTHLSDACNTGLCDPLDGSCYAEPNYFEEGFTDNSNLWTFDGDWEIGPATASISCSSIDGFTQDPATDHTMANDDNGIAGVNIGGCVEMAIHDYYCMTSPVVNTEEMVSPYFEFWRWLNCDIEDYMFAKVDIWDGGSWQNLFITEGFVGTADSQWTLFRFDITTYQHAENQVRFCYNTIDSDLLPVSGWNVDDVLIAPDGCVP